MCIDHKRKVIFIHIPKTAGIYIRNILDLPKPKGNLKKDHVKPSYPEIKSNWENYLTFTFVRNPYDRLVSSYFFDYFRASQGRFSCQGNIRKEVFHFGNNRNGFEEFVKNKIHCDFNGNIKYMPMTSILENKKPDHIFRFENLNEDLRKAYFLIHSKNLKIPSTKRTNASKHEHFSYYYTNSKIKKMIREYYNEDFIQFGYKEAK